MPGSLLVPTLGGMRWMSSDGTWVVELVRRTASGNGRDGEWLRVLHHGFKVGEARGMVLPAWAWMSPACGRPNPLRTPLL